MNTFAANAFTLSHILQLRFPYHITALLWCICVWGSSCRQAERPVSLNNGDTVAVTAFIRQIEIIKESGDDSLMGPQVRELYTAAGKSIHNAVFPSVLKALGTILLFHNSADPLVIPFYRGLYTEAGLNAKNRSMAGVKLANYYAHIERNADSADYYLQNARTHPEALNDTLRANICGIEAQIFTLRGQPQKAAASLYRHIALSESLHDSLGFTGAYINLANVYRGMRDYGKSITLRRKALAYFMQRGDEASEVTAIGGLGADFIDLNQFDSARRYLLQAEALFKKGIRSPVAEYYLYLSKAGMYVTLKKFDSSVLYFDRARKMLPLFNDPAQERFFTITSAIAYAHIRRVDKEAALINSYIPQMLVDSDLQSATTAYYSLYHIALNQKIAGGDALTYYQLYDSLKTILSDNRNRDFVAEMEFKYESQKKNLTIEVQQRELRQKNTENMALLLSLVAAALLTGVFFILLQLQRSRHESKMQQGFMRELLKNTEAERGRIAGELHDGISHELLTLKNNLQCETAATEARIDAIINDIRMISRNLHPVMLDKIGLKYSIEHLCGQLMASGQLFVSAAIDYDRQLLPGDELQLYRIIQESLNNIVKYACAHAAKISILPANGKLLVSIIDNGKGFNVAEQLTSKSAFGLHSIIERGKALGGRTIITSTAGGTVINVEIPY